MINFAPDAHAWTHQHRWSNRHMRRGPHLFISPVKRLNACVWWWPWCRFATFATTSQSVKVPQTTCTMSSRQRSHLLCCQLPVPVCHATLHSRDLRENLHVRCGMMCISPVPPALIARFLLGSVEKRRSCLKRCVCGLKIFGQWVLILS